MLTRQRQAHNLDRLRFEQSLAQYRSQVQEALYLATTSQSGSMEETIQQQLEKPTILVVEDNTDDWFLTRYGLGKQFPEAELVWLRYGAHVMPHLDQNLDQYERTEKELPRLIVLDLYLPSATRGLRVLEDLKTHPIYQSIPTVVFSHSADPADITAVFTHSANAYVVKPIQSKEWQQVFREFEPFWQKVRRSDESPPELNKP